MKKEEIPNFNLMVAPIKERTTGRIEKIVLYIGTKKFLLHATIFFLAYFAFNSLPFLHKYAFDVPPFLSLNVAVSICSFFAVTLIGILDKVKADVDKRTTDLYHDYEYHVFTLFNEKLDKLEESNKALIKQIDALTHNPHHNLHQK